MSSRNIPWVDFNENISDIWFYTMLSGQKNLSLGKEIFSTIARFRTRYNIFGFPLDRKIYEKSKMLYYRMKKGS